jgi:iron complex outermembrane receptor protein
MVSIEGSSQSPEEKHDLTTMSLEDLMKVKVTSASRKEQTLSRTASAIYVITSEEIARSGATNVPDLLRMVPGVQVAQMTANTWAISIRGFNSRYSNNVLVLIDGRTVYSSSFGGVFWDQTELPLEDIDRIEVIRGPGGTVWGANAVNGVINIITKSSKVTKGGLISVGGGSEDLASTTIRYGDGIGQSGSYRLFGNYFQRADLPLPGSTTSGEDGWSRIHGGFRSDWDLSKRDLLTFQGDLFYNRESETVFTTLIPTPFTRSFAQSFDVGGGNLLGRWKRSSPGGSETSLQVYYDQYRRTELGIPETDKTLDVDFQNHLTTQGRHDVVWGVGFRSADISLAPGHFISFIPPARDENLFSTFIQDEIRLTNSLWLTAGSKFEHNRFTGFEYQPSVRLAWLPTRETTLWVAASRAIRQPVRQDADISTDLATFPLAANITEQVVLMGNPSLKAPAVHEFEAGYRSQLTKRLSLDVTGFLGFYRHLLTIEPQLPVTSLTPSGVLITVPFIYQNLAHAQNYGGEAYVTWNITSRWKISPGYSYLTMEQGLDPASHRAFLGVSPGDNPRHMFQVRSRLNLTRKLDVDNSLYYVDKLAVGNVPAYTRVDTRVGWRLGERTEFSLVGRNLLSARYTEFGDAIAFQNTQVRRNVFAKITWQF